MELSKYREVAHQFLTTVVTSILCDIKWRLVLSVT
jgi:hypothetical protein